MSSLCVRLALHPSIHFLQFPPTCIDKFSWNLKCDVGFFNTFPFRKVLYKNSFLNVHDGRIMHRLRCSGIFNTKHPVIILRASLFVVTPSHVASSKNGCQNFSYVYRSRKHLTCKYFFLKASSSLSFKASDASGSPSIYTDTTRKGCFEKKSSSPK